MSRLLLILVCGLFFIGAGSPEGDCPFLSRAESLCAIRTPQSMRQAVVEYTSAILENPRNGAALRGRALILADIGRYRPALHDADTAFMYGMDEMDYYYLAGRSKPSIEYLRRAYRRACLKADLPMIRAAGELLLNYETKYLYVTEDDIILP